MGPAIVPLVRGEPDGVVGRDDPGACIRPDGQQTVAQAGELPARMAVGAEFAALGLGFVQRDDQRVGCVAGSKRELFLRNGGNSLLIGSNRLAQPQPAG